MSELSLLQFALRLATAAALGALIGVERQATHHTAGLKTNALASTGSALFVMLASAADHPEAYSRIAAQIISGMGFLGGGVILRDGLNIRGLTTAATLWCAAAVGTLSGSGSLKQAMIGCLAVLCINVLLKPVSKRIGEDSLTGEGVASTYRIRVVCPSVDEQAIRRELLEMAAANKLAVDGIKTERHPDRGSEISGEFRTASNSKIDMDNLLVQFGTREGITGVEWHRLSSS